MLWNGYVREFDTDITVTVDDPDNMHGMPAYVGPPERAYEMIMEGIYPCIATCRMADGTYEDVESVLVVTEYSSWAE